jgi:peptidyl-prolyl cis-trans isomerase SurA
VSTKSYKNPAAAHKVVSQALKDIKSGESFAEVAKRLSDDASAPAGGDLGVLKEDQMSPTFREAIKKLQIGQVSDIVGGPSTGRYYIIKLLDVKSSDTDQLDKVREEIRAQLASSEYQHQISLWLERQRQSAFIHRAGEPAIKEMTSQP